MIRTYLEHKAARANAQLQQGEFVGLGSDLAPLGVQSNYHKTWRSVTFDILDELLYDDRINCDRCLDCRVVLVEGNVVVRRRRSRTDELHLVVVRHPLTPQRLRLNGSRLVGGRPLTPQRLRFSISDVALRVVLGLRRARREAAGVADRRPQSW